MFLELYSLLEESIAPGPLCTCSSTGFDSVWYVICYFTVSRSDCSGSLSARGRAEPREPHGPGSDAISIGIELNTI